ncbi:MAG: hypothetical protein NC548_63025 [Lachnospiraceae bacterium]|nr:hypothetical protein [Lachnospiraceae bacterium]
MFRPEAFTKEREVYPEQLKGGCLIQFRIGLKNSRHTSALLIGFSHCRLICKWDL